MKKETVFVGLSGGVDSSITAYLLKQLNYNVVGVYMQNWTANVGSWECPWHQDYLSAKNLAVFLGIDFLTFNFEKEYRELVVESMLADYQAGLTPNPDVVCNRQIKFRLFYQAAKDRGADKIATGHYAKTDGRNLLRPKDKFKDQTYFLARINRQILSDILWPLGDYTKAEVRDLANKSHLPTAQQPESMGLCFIGDIGLASFLKANLDLKPGQIISDDDGQVVGRHQGACLYTIGQRKGLQIGGRRSNSGQPYYVIDKDMSQNQVFVTQKINHPKLWRETITIIKPHWFVEPTLNRAYQLRIRHQGDLIESKLVSTDDGFQFQLEGSIRGVTPGQVLVIYDWESKFVVGSGYMT